VPGNAPLQDGFEMLEKFAQRQGIKNTSRIGECAPTLEAHPLSVNLN
jgi:hypothetical protein